MNDKEIKTNEKRLAKRDKLFAKQLKDRGWTDEDTWSLDWVIAKHILPRLKRFKEIQNGYPNGETEKSWNKKLDTMIKAFEVAANDPWSMSEKQEKTANEGLKLFAENYFNLWW